MKNLLQNLLIFLALCLCGMLAFQWLRETGLRKDKQELTDREHDALVTITNLQASLRADQAEIKRLDGLKNQFMELVTSNQTQIAHLNERLDRLAVQKERASAEAAAYSNALQVANSNITRQNEDIRQLNQRLKDLADLHNDSVREYNALATNYTELVEKWNAQQAALARSATNTAPKN